MCLIRPEIDLVGGVLLVHVPGFAPLSVPLVPPSHASTIQLCSAKVCGSEYVCIPFEIISSRTKVFKCCTAWTGGIAAPMLQRL
jgi:hypothetical protein